MNIPKEKMKFHQLLLLEEILETNIAHENPIFPGKYHQNGGFSMAMLVLGSVPFFCVHPFRCFVFLPGFLPLYTPKITQYNPGIIFFGFQDQVLMPPKALFNQLRDIGIFLQGFICDLAGKVLMSKISRQRPVGLVAYTYTGYVRLLPVKGEVSQLYWNINNGMCC